ncbi:hypothetical protein EDC02_5186 [Micromonospora sp. Llam0]|uniref:hypothetical protein n=1 Tax=Micromonospora sp. Llam0 TaxID=2485143 RepID=UPI000F47EB3B|nr:hypothetical protein [Micromonospora sp. Llam0]ROO63168.1 hypothetical protein EDC02_5186 [Micromonospora sp. Llam0]
MGGRAAGSHSAHADGSSTPPQPLRAGWRAMKVELNPGTPNAKVVLDVSQFDFDRRAVTWAAARGPGSGAVDHAERIGPERCGWDLRPRPRRTREMKR